MRPLDNFRRVVSTEGQDIREIVTAIKDLRTAYLGAEIILLDLFGGHHLRGDASRQRSLNSRRPGLRVGSAG